MASKTCEELGWKVGDRFQFIGSDGTFKMGEIITLELDDKSRCPRFENKGGRRGWCYTREVEPIVEHPHGYSIALKCSGEQYMELMYESQEYFDAAVKGLLEGSLKRRNNG